MKWEVCRWHKTTINRNRFNIFSRLYHALIVQEVFHPKNDVFVRMEEACHLTFPPSFLVMHIPSYFHVDACCSNVQCYEVLTSNFPIPLHCLGRVN